MHKKIICIVLIGIMIFPVKCFADEIDDELDDEVIEVASNNITELNVNSKHVIAIDRKNLNVLYEKDAYTEVAMASTTKIMTCIIAIENCDLNKVITISKNSAMVSGSKLGLNTDDKLTINDVLYGLMLRSRK